MARSDRRTGERRKGERRALARSAASAPATPPPARAAHEAKPERRTRDRRGTERRSTPRRREERHASELRVDWRCDDTFLYAYASNVSNLGIFIQTREPAAPGTLLDLVFEPDGQMPPFTVPGIVAWVNAYRENGDNPNPGMGVRFTEMDLPTRERLLALIRRIAYLRGDPPAQA